MLEGIFHFRTVICPYRSQSNVSVNSARSVVDESTIYSTEVLGARAEVNAESISKSQGCEQFAMNNEWHLEWLRGCQPTVACTYPCVCECMCMRKYKSVNYHGVTLFQIPTLEELFKVKNRRF